MKITKSHFSPYLILFFGYLLLFSCGPMDIPENAMRGNIIIDGSSTVYPLTEAIVEEFRIDEPGIMVTIGVSGTGGGFKKFGRDESDISNASRPIIKEEIEAAAANGVDFIEIPVAFDGLVVVVHPDNHWVDYLTVDELKKLWEPEAQGVITRWNQVRESFPDEEIHLFGAGTASGTFDYFTEAIVGKQHSSRGDFTASEDDNVLVQGVSTDRLALAFFGLAYYEENKSLMKVVPIAMDNSQNGADAVFPSTETVMNSTYQPLSRPLFIYVTKSASERPEVITFIEFYIQNIGLLCSDVGYIALPKEVYDLALERFRKRKYGSMLEEGQSLVGVNLLEILRK